MREQLRRIGRKRQIVRLKVISIAGFFICVKNKTVDMEKTGHLVFFCACRANVHRRRSNGLRHRCTCLRSHSSSYFCSASRFYDYMHALVGLFTMKKKRRIASEKNRIQAHNFQNYYPCQSADRVSI